MIASPNNIGVDDHVDRSAGDVGGTVILFKREILDEWVTLTDSVIVQTFDFIRIRLSSVGGWSNRADPKRTVDGDLMYRSALEPGRASYARGAQIVRSGMKKEELFDGLGWSPTKKKDSRQYASFVAHDFKNNEEPKGPISKRAFTTDFKGKWDLDYDPLPSLRAILQEWDRRQVLWWTLRNEKLVDQVHYPVTTAADEWATELMNLHQLLVEGFEEKWLTRKAKDLGRNPDPKFRSFKLIEECLMGIGYEENHAREITAPLHRLHDLRSKVKGHASGKEATDSDAVSGAATAISAS